MNGGISKAENGQTGAKTFGAQGDAAVNIKEYSKTIEEVSNILAAALLTNEPDLKADALNCDGPMRALAPAAGKEGVRKVMAKLANDEVDAWIAMGFTVDENRQVQITTVLGIPSLRTARYRRSA